MRIILTALTVLLLSACAPQSSMSLSKGKVNDPFVVEIYWSDTDTCIVRDVKEDKDGRCSIFSSKLCLRREQHVEWRSMNPSNAAYEIYFDPIQGAPLQTNNGRLKRKIDNDAPIADYKYSILRDGCDPTKVNTYDPHIRIVN